MPVGLGRRERGPVWSGPVGGVGRWKFVLGRERERDGKVEQRGIKWCARLLRASVRGLKEERHEERVVRVLGEGGGG